MKQRPLTEIQLTVLQMKLSGCSREGIGAKLCIHPDTVSGKYQAIMRGIAKGSYNNLPAEYRATGDLFDNEGCI